ncbi:glycosyltransferase family 4 protein [Pseudofrankia inefficax]|uniref:Glycosyl transferase group 1 n=1 Tax=Pseudofrankia inefficax (strain DSM 45817 / CECT 9037 / DDB 130130 / EuI1c) TaxID=298654 RepID=E3J947_PSEI1|nr:glycosyltransferase family 4 protein [Pseudofrankia inefficax]ADP80926.1 glycosyl transferase group 1 [Pseudofrankia inefficax]
MRIVHATDCYLPRLGGIELHVRDLAQRQRSDGHQVTVATRTQQPTEALWPTESGDWDEPHVLRLRTLGKDRLEWLAPDVVHVHLSVVSPFALAAARRAAELGIPTVVTVHSLWSDLARVAPLVRSTMGAHRWPVVWTAVSRQAAAYVERVVARDVGVLPNAVDVGFWRGRPASDQPRLAAGNHPPTILSVMRLTTVKRTIPLARVLHRVSDETDIRAVIVGDGPKRAALERYLRRHGLAERVRLVGALDRNRVRAAMATAAIFVAPAHRESFGIAALEARTAGLPVVARAASGVASFICDRREGLLADSDRALARHTLELVRNVDLRREIIDHNRAVPPDLSWSAALRSNHDAYALAGARGGSRCLAVPTRRSQVLVADR